MAMQCMPLRTSNAVANCTRRIFIRQLSSHRQPLPRHTPRGIDYLDQFHSNKFLTNSPLLRTLCASANAHSDQQTKIADKFKPQVNFCRVCGSKMSVQQPDGDREWRHVCTSCGYIDYINPKMVVGCIVEHQGKVLMCKRAIEPCKGKWTLPAGFMEWNESSAAGAARETLEEANASVQVLAPYFHIDIPVIGQAYILFRAQLLAPFTFSPGPETLETQFFSPQDIPFDQVAFSSVAITLQHYVDDLKQGTFHVHHGVIDKQPGSEPNDIKSYVLRNHMVLSITPSS